MNRLRRLPLSIWQPLAVFLAFAGLLAAEAVVSGLPLWLAALGMAALLALVLHFTVVRPAAYLLQAAGQLARGESTGEIQTGGVSELSEMADTLNFIYRRFRTNVDALRLAATAFETHEGIVITDPRGRVLRVNRAFSKLTGYAAEEVLGRNARRLLARHPDCANYRKIGSALRQQDYWEGEIWKRRKERGPCLVWLRITAVRDESGNLTNYVGATLDLSEIDDERAKTQRAAAEEHAIGELLRLALQPFDSTVFLQRSLEAMLASVSWLNLLPKGVIFINEAEAGEEVLRMVASHNLEPAQVDTCARVPLGRCLCGAVALSRSAQFTACVDARHETRYLGIMPHAHYALPILADHRLLGVLALYLPEGHSHSTQEEAFLNRVTDVLSIGLSMRQARAEVAYHARHDPLTGLPNRHLLLERLQQEMAMARRRKAFGAVLFIDLDNFKTFNDALGHASGDALLSQIAERLTQRVRAGDTVVRHGGDEFLVVLPDLGNDKTLASYEARRVADKLRDGIIEPIYLGGRQLHVTPSMGITLFPHNGDDPEAVLQHAEVAMYRAKQAGRDTTRFYAPDMQAAAESRLQLQNDLRHALNADELKLHYQPQIDSLGRLRGVEALLRWNHGKRGMISPAEFIPIAEETGLILAIGHWVLQQACRQIVAWQQAGVNLGSVAVNVSARQFHQADFVARVERILAETGADPRLLELELTESVLIGNLTEAVDKMQVLRRRGVRFSIDDFGTGYSSLAYLKQLPLDRLKIDQSFVRELTLDSRDAAIIRAVLSIAGHLGFEVVAEGVETEAQRLALLEMGCTLFQGYHLGRPMAAAELPLHLTP
ncbi:MAG: EAL domain-containing protein [Pseudomonadota bacterium]|nr:EAL domain-containing protein [Pseudomonadota bacterium]MDP1903534.1 EAL domain-containing protein [Pseudomonadota bacterium]MDP2351429.1 EAL domain-containing protein [Pseudomonadota bacterium]